MDCRNIVLLETESMYSVSQHISHGGNLAKDPVERFRMQKKNCNAAQNRKVYNIIGVKVGREKAGTYICMVICAPGLLV